MCACMTDVVHQAHQNRRQGGVSGGHVTRRACACRNRCATSWHTRTRPPTRRGRRAPRCSGSCRTAGATSTGERCRPCAAHVTAGLTLPTSHRAALRRAMRHGPRRLARPAPARWALRCCHACQMRRKRAALRSHAQWTCPWSWSTPASCSCLRALHRWVRSCWRKWGFCGIVAMF